MEKRRHPEKIGRYSIVGIIGRGGMGTVYRALNPGREEVVALKILRPAEPLVDLLGMPKLHEIFTAEAEKMAGLNHPHIVRVLDLGSEDGTPFFTMEYHCNNIGMLIGEHFILEETTRVINPDKVLTYGSQVLEGLRCIHAAGVVHRDIKPHNILITDEDTVRICDFGMAKQEDEEAFAAAGLKIGSPYYISPEQNKNPQNADRRADLYSTAVMLYRMLTGEFPGMKSFLLSRINPLYDRKWDDFFIKGLEWNPAGRFQDANEMAAALLQLELHLHKKKNATCRAVREIESGEAEGLHRLRTFPLRVSGVEAQHAFAVNKLWQPARHIVNTFTRRCAESLLDRATGLIWLRNDHDSPVSRDEADGVIAALNAARCCGLSSWRLPTVNELLSLVSDPALIAGECAEHMPQLGNNWYWSCDRRSDKTSWYVNIRPGYTGWQENGCRYSVRAVASFPEDSRASP